MSWEVNSVDDHPCPCKNGTYSIKSESDDWHRRRERVSMNCSDCQTNYIQYEYETRSGNVNWQWKDIASILKDVMDRKYHSGSEINNIRRLEALGYLKYNEYTLMKTLTSKGEDVM